MSILRDSTVVLPGREALLATPVRYAERGKDLVLGFVPGASEPIAMDRVEYALLDALRFPCLPEGLAERLAAAGWTSEESEELPALVAGLEGRGLIGKLGAILDGFDEPEGDDRPTITHLAWITKDRPETLKASLEAWGRALDRGNVKLPAFVVADDSLEREAETRAVVEAFARDYRGEVYLLDRAFRERFAGELGRADGVDADALRFTLALDELGPSGQGRYGSSRNLLLLTLAGRAFVMTDDDTFPDFRLHPGALDGLALCSNFDTVERTTFLDARELESFGSPARGYPFEPHERLLGLSCRGVAEAFGTLDLGRLDAASLERLFGPRARVGVVAFGSYGDSGSGTARYLLLPRSAVGSEPYAPGDPYLRDRYEAALVNKLVFRAPRRASIGGGSFMGMHATLDARSMLPPFSPSCRNEDGLWSVCLYLLHPDRKMAHAAEAVRHRPAEARSLTRDATVRWENRLNDACIDLALSLRGSLARCDDPYRCYGEALSSIGVLPPDQFKHRMAAIHRAFTERRLAKCDEELDRYGGEPEHWAADLEEAKASLLTSLDSDRAWLPTEFHGDAEAYGAYIARLGQLLLAWPRLYEAAVDLSTVILGALQSQWGNDKAATRSRASSRG